MSRFRNRSFPSEKRKHQESKGRLNQMEDILYKYEQRSKDLEDQELSKKCEVEMTLNLIPAVIWSICKKVQDGGIPPSEVTATVFNSIFNQSRSNYHLNEAPRNRQIRGTFERYEAPPQLRNLICPPCPNRKGTFNVRELEDQGYRSVEEPRQRELGTSTDSHALSILQNIETRVEAMIINSQDQIKAVEQYKMKYLPLHSEDQTKGTPQIPEGNLKLDLDARESAGVNEHQLFSSDLASVPSIKSEEIECMKRLQELVKSESDAKKRIKELERKEKALIETFHRTAEIRPTSETESSRKPVPAEEREIKMPHEVEPTEKVAISRYKEENKLLEDKVRDMKQNEEILQRRIYSLAAEKEQLLEEVTQLRGELVCLQTEVKESKVNFEDSSKVPVRTTKYIGQDEKETMKKPEIRETEDITNMTKLSKEKMEPTLLKDVEAASPFPCKEVCWGGCKCEPDQHLQSAAPVHTTKYVGQDEKESLRKPEMRETEDITNVTKLSKEKMDPTLLKDVEAASPFPCKEICWGGCKCEPIQHFQPAASDQDTKIPVVVVTEVKESEDPAKMTKQLSKEKTEPFHLKEQDADALPPYSCDGICKDYCTCALVSQPAVSVKVSEDTREEIRPAAKVTEYISEEFTAPDTVAKLTVPTAVQKESEDIKYSPIVVNQEQKEVKNSIEKAEEVSEGITLTMEMKESLSKDTDDPINIMEQVSQGFKDVIQVMKRVSGDIKDTETITKKLCVDNERPVTMKQVSKEILTAIKVIRQMSKEVMNPVKSYESKEMKDYIEHAHEPTTPSASIRPCISICWGGCKCTAVQISQPSIQVEKESPSDPEKIETTKSKQSTQKEFWPSFISGTPDLEPVSAKKTSSLINDNGKVSQKSVSSSTKMSNRRIKSAPHTNGAVPKREGDIETPIMTYNYISSFITSEPSFTKSSQRNAEVNQEQLWRHFENDTCNKELQEDIETSLLTYGNEPAFLKSKSSVIAKLNVQFSSPVTEVSDMPAEFSENLSMQTETVEKVTTYQPEIKVKSEIEAHENKEFSAEKLDITKTALGPEVHTDKDKTLVENSEVVDETTPKDDEGGYDEKSGTIATETAEGIVEQAVKPDSVDKEIKSEESKKSAEVIWTHFIDDTCHMELEEDINLSPMTFISKSAVSATDKAVVESLTPIVTRKKSEDQDTRTKSEELSKSATATATGTAEGTVERSVKPNNVDNEESKKSAEVIWSYFIDDTCNLELEEDINSSRMTYICEPAVTATDAIVPKSITPIPSDKITKPEELRKSIEDMWPHFIDDTCNLELEEDINSSRMTYICEPAVTATGAIGPESITPIPSDKITKPEELRKSIEDMWPHFIDDVCNLELIEDTSFSRMTCMCEPTVAATVETVPKSVTPVVPDKRTEPEEIKKSTEDMWSHFINDVCNLELQEDMDLSPLTYKDKPDTTYGAKSEMTSRAIETTITSETLKELEEEEPELPQRDVQESEAPNLDTTDDKEELMDTVASSYDIVEDVLQKFIKQLYNDLEQQQERKSSFQPKDTKMTEVQTCVTDLQFQESSLERKRAGKNIVVRKCISSDVAEGDVSLHFTVSGLMISVAGLKDKCRIKDHIITALANELQLRSKSGIFENLLTNVALDDTHFEPLHDFDREQLCEFLNRPEGYSGRPPPPHPEPIGMRMIGTSSKPQRKILSQPKCKQYKVRKSTPSPLSLRLLYKIDHDSILIGWTAPKGKNIVGYEIYVNGILAQKVYSPSRDRALLHYLDLNKTIVITMYALTPKGRCTEPARLVLPSPEVEETTNIECRCIYNIK